MCYYIFLCVLVLGFASSAPTSHQTVTLPLLVSEVILQNLFACVTETKVDPMALFAFKKELPDSEEYKKFYYCAMIKSNVAAENGDLYLDKFLSYYPDTVDKEGVRQTIMDCDVKEHISAVEKIFKEIKCYQEKTPVHVILQLEV